MNITFLEHPETIASGPGINHAPVPSKFKGRTVLQSLNGDNGLLVELGRSQSEDVRIGLGCRLGKDGRLLASCGFFGHAISLKYTLNKGKEDEIQIEQMFSEFDHPACNIWAAARCVENLRLIRRYCGDAIANQAASAFAALPSPEKRWFEILGCREDDKPTIVKAHYVVAARANHPDAGGSDSAMAEINNLGRVPGTQGRTVMAVAPLITFFCCYCNPPEFHDHCDRHRCEQCNRTLCRSCFIGEWELDEDEDTGDICFDCIMKSAGILDEEEGEEDK